MIDYTITWEKVKSNHPELTNELSALQEVKETAYKNICIACFIGGMIVTYCIMGVILWLKNSYSYVYVYV